MKNLITLFAILILDINIYSSASLSQEIQGGDVIYEKVYLHIDREMYAPRDNIWFKVYLVGGINNQLLEGYRNVYVQLVNDTGRVVDDRLVLSSDGVASGDFTLPYNIDEGQYTIRAYTKYLENLGEKSYFHKKIWISSMKQQPKAQKEFHLEDIDIGFYPESGNLVLNASNWIALKAIDTNGRGIPIAGKIVNDLGETITGFSSEFLGMGKFSLMPKEGRTYYAHLDDFPDYRYEFNDIQKNGVVLHFVDGITEIKFVLARNFSIVEEAEYTISASHKGAEMFSKAVEMRSFSAEISFPKAKFPIGISKITLRDQSGQVVSERIVFVQTENENLITIETDSKVYKNRDKVGLYLSSNLDETDTIKGGLSVSVVNKNYLNRQGYNSNIQSYLFLDSELKGPIESSASYFVNDRISSYEKLNLLMMVQGWRSYYWQDRNIEKSKNIEGWEDIGLTVSGTVKRLYKNEIVRDAEVVMGPINGRFMDTLTNIEGHFSFDKLYLRDSSTIMLEAKNMKGRKNVEIFLEPMYNPDTLISISAVNEEVIAPMVPRSFYAESFSKLEAERRYAIESGFNWIEEVSIVEEKPLSFVESIKKENSKIFGTPDHTVTISDEDMIFDDIFDYLESNPVPGVYVSGGVIWSKSGGRVQIMVDGIIELTPSDIPMGDIDYIDFMTTGAKKALFGSTGSGGIVSIYTKVGELSTFERYVKGRVVKEVHGFQEPRVFYSPKYSLENFENEKPDYRPTLFWEPFVFLQDNLVKLEFFTSDYHSDCVVIVEGISMSGKICIGIGEFSVGR